MTSRDEQHERARMIRSSVPAIGTAVDLTRIRKLRFSEYGFSKDTWREIVALGWLGLRIPEDAGGAGLGAYEYCALAEELGRALVPEPLVTAALAARLHPKVLEEDRLILPAWQERSGALSRGPANGNKRFVVGARGADAFLVVSDEGARIVDAKSVSLEITAVQDGGHFGAFTTTAAGEPVSDAEWPAALDDAVLATAAYLLGVLEAALARTVEYLDTRKQFGVKIGTFQALQHRTVDMALQARLARAVVEEVARAVDSGIAGSERAAAVSRAKARASEAALFVTRQSVQLHGGVGCTDEHDIGLYLRKALVVAASFGGASVHRARWAEHHHAL